MAGKKAAASVNHASDPILCATDFSANATEAAGIAAAMAARVRRPLLLSHNAVMSRADFGREREWEEYLKGVDHLLERHAQDLARADLQILTERLRQRM